MSASDDAQTLCRDRQVDRPCRWDRDASSVHDALNDIRSTLAEIQSDLKVGQQRFKVLEAIVFGAAALVGLTVLGSVLALLFNKGGGS